MILTKGPDLTVDTTINYGPIPRPLYWILNVRIPKIIVADLKKGEGVQVYVRWFGEVRGNEIKNITLKNNDLQYLFPLCIHPRNEEVFPDPESGLIEDCQVVSIDKSNKSEFNDELIFACYEGESRMAHAKIMPREFPDFGIIQPTRYIDPCRGDQVKRIRIE